jgi:uncharacterized membrane protein
MQGAVDVETSYQLLNLLAASAVFVALHRVISGTSIRAHIVARLSERVFLRVFALASALSLAWLAFAYAVAQPEASNQRLFIVGPLHRLMQFPVQLAAMLLVVFGLTTRSPTIAGQGQSLDRPDIVQGVLRVTRHPFLWGVALLAGGHMSVAADVASWVFFGTLALVALAGTISIDAKRERMSGAAWTEYAARTSNVPFVAILRGHQPFRSDEIGWWRFLLGIGLYLAAIAIHFQAFA